MAEWKKRNKYLFDERWKTLNRKEQNDMAFKIWRTNDWLWLALLCAVLVGFVLGIVFQNMNIAHSQEASTDFKQVSYEIARQYCIESGNGELIKVSQRVTPAGAEYTAVECERSSKLISGG